MEPKPTPPQPAWRVAFTEVFGLDTRSLAAMRVGLGLLILADLWVRASDVSVFYTDQGVLPRKAWLEYTYRELQFSLHMGGGLANHQLFLFGVAAVFAGMLVVGYKTRLATIASWVLLVSLQNRNAYVLQSGDVVFRLLLFWSMFLPLGARFSLDAARRTDPSAELPRTVLGVATAALGAQMGFIYIFTWFLKTGSVWRNGLAVYYALNIDMYARQPMASWLLAEPLVWQTLTHSTFWLELIGPFLLLMPVFRGPVRVLVVAAFISMHLGFDLGLEIGLFSYICAVGWIGLLPGWFWDRLGLTLRRRSPTQVLSAPNHLLAAFFLWMSFHWNMTTIPTYWMPTDRWSVPLSVRWIGSVLRIDQKWEMFAPYPLKDDGWFVIPAKMVNGAEVDLWVNGPVDYEKPDVPSTEYKNQRWRKYMRNLWMKSNKKLRQPFAQYLCRSWNKDHQGGEKVKSLQIIYMKEVTPKPGEAATVETVEIWDHDCFSTADQNATQPTRIGDAPKPTASPRPSKGAALPIPLGGAVQVPTPDALSPALPMPAAPAADEEAETPADGG